MFKASNRIIARSSLLYRCFSNYPPHIVVGMPALSPTMAAGTIGKWHVNPGDLAKVGSTYADVETDKASMAFEVQDESYIAKILVPAGTEVTVGTPILITVDDKDSVAAFENYVVASVSAPAPAPVAAVPVHPVKQTPPSPPPVAASPSPIVSTPPPAPKPAAITPPPAPKPTPVASFVWGSGVKSSAIFHKLAKDQQAYIEKFGRSALKPLKEQK